MGRCISEAKRDGKEVCTPTLARGLDRWPNAAVVRITVAAASLLSTVLSASLALPALAEQDGPLRIDGLASRAPDRILVFVVRSDGIEIPVVSFLDVVRRTIDAHMHARVVSMEEAFVRAGDSLQRRLAECKGDDGCYARLAGSVEARYLLVVSATRVGELEVVGARMLDLSAVAPIGNAIDPLAPGMDMLEALPSRIQAAVPADLWDPFGAIVVRVDQPGAEVTVNGKVIGVTPFDKIGFLLPATYRVTAAKAGFVRAEAETTVLRGEDAQLAFTMVEEDNELMPWWAWTLIGVGVAAGAGLGIGLAVSGGGPTAVCSVPASNVGACEQ